VLTDEELGLLWKATELSGSPFGPLFQLLILTGQRREEVAGLDWSELDRPTGSWLIPGYRTKNRKANYIPLSKAAIAVLDGIAADHPWPRTGYVFSTTGKTPVSGFSKAKRRMDELMRESLGERFQPWRAHDLRRTLATGMQRLGVRFEVTEAILNHVSGSRAGVAGIYQRYDWAAEKRDALGAWGAALDTIRERVASRVELG
jgi:integrase